MGRGAGALLEEELGCGLLDHFSSSLLTSILSAHLLAGLHLAEGEGALWGRAARKARKGRGAGAKGRRRKGARAAGGEPLRMRRLRRVALSAAVPGHFSQGLRRW